MRGGAPGQLRDPRGDAAVGRDPGGSPHGGMPRGLAAPTRGQAVGVCLPPSDWVRSAVVRACGQPGQRWQFASGWLDR